VPDPEDPATFDRSKLTWSEGPENHAMLEWYRQLLQLRQQCVTRAKRTADAQYSEGVLTMQVPAQNPNLVVIARLKSGAKFPPLENDWRELLHSAEDGYEVSIRTREVPA
jgi:1,4-alpha-glucan branching enzyme